MYISFEQLLPAVVEIKAALLGIAAEVSHAEAIETFLLISLKSSLYAGAVLVEGGRQANVLLLHSQDLSWRICHMCTC